MDKKKNQKQIAIFEGKKIRRYWDDIKELWYFSVVDIIEILIGTDRPRKYWNDLKAKLKAEGSEVSEKIGQLKMQATDGKFYLTDAASLEANFTLAYKHNPHYTHGGLQIADYVAYAVFQVFERIKISKKGCL